MTRERIRPWVVAAWVALCLVTAWEHALESAEGFDRAPDYVTGMIEELRPLDRSIPRHIGVAYVGINEIPGCKPAWVARNVLAPRVVADDLAAEHFDWLAERGIDVPPPRHIVVAWGDVGARWIANHPDEVRVLYRASPRVLVGWRR